VGALCDGRRESADRRFGFAELVEGLLVQRRIMSDRREVVAQPFFVFDELATLLSFSSSAFCCPSACRREASSPRAFLTEGSSSFEATSTPRRSSARSKSWSSLRADAPSSL